MIEQQTPEWFAIKRGKVSASRISDILAKTKTGFSASRANYLIELALQRITGKTEETYKNDAMLLGTEREPIARSLYEFTTDTVVDQIAWVDHPTIEWSGASPDGLVGEDGLIEIKCCSTKTHWSFIKANEPPSNYLYQMQWQMACTGRKWNDWVCYNPDFPEPHQLFVKRIVRDDKLISDIEKAVQQFLVEVAKETELMRGN